MKTDKVLPNFLVIGAQRCATSWMYFCLKEHPDIFLPFIKEVHYFCDFYEKGFVWYERYFNICKGQKAIGEISPSYLYSEKAPERISRDLKDVRLIVCLRNPIDRAYSQYKKHLRAGTQTKSFEEAMEADPQYIERGYYFQQISRYLEFFPREKLLILFYDDLMNNPLVFLKNIFSFLEVDANFVPSSCNKTIPSERLKSAYSYIHNVSFFLQSKMNLSKLINYLKKPLLLKILDKFFTSKVAYSMIPRDNTDKLKVNPMNEKTRKKLQRVFYDENRKLADYVGRDLSSWI